MMTVDKNKEQHFNSSCASVCIATLLSNLGIDKEDYDVIQESYMAYLLKYDKQSNMITAGLKMQTPEVFNRMLRKYKLLYKVKQCSNWAQFKTTSDILFKQDIPFMIGLKTKFAFGNVENMDDLKHAIVIYKQNKDHYCFVNPMKRGSKVKNVTILPMTIMKDAIKCLGKFKVGYIVRNRNNSKNEHTRLFDNGKDALQIFQKKMDKLDRLIGEKKIDEEKYMKYLQNYIKPIALDLLTAVEAINDKTITQRKLESKLRDFQLFARTIQKAIKNNEKIPRAENTFHGFAKEIMLLFNKHFVEMARSV